MPVTPQPSVSVNTDNVNNQEARNAMSATSAVRISKFLAKPSIFRGEKKDSSNPMVWLNAMERIYTGMNFSDDEMLIVLASYFAGPAAIWWNVIEPKIRTWESFVKEFTIQFASESQKDAWWEELENLRQDGNQTVDDIKFRIMELSTLLSVNDSTKIRYFMRAILKPIALRVADVNPLLTNWEEVTACAKRIEMNENKYGNGVIMEVNKVPTKVIVPTQFSYGYSGQDNISNISVESNSGSTSLNSLASTVDRLCQGFDALQLSLNTANNSGGNQRNTNQVRIANPPVNNNERRCYNCQDFGHIATYCPKPRIPRRVQPNYGGNDGGDNHQENERTPASGVNSIPIGENNSNSVMGKVQGRY